MGFDLMFDIFLLMKVLDLILISFLMVLLLSFDFLMFFDGF